MEYRAVISRLPVWACLFTLLVSGGCDRRVEPFVPLEDEPPPPARPVRIPGIEQASPQRQIDLGAAIQPATGARSGAASAIPASAPRIRGVIRLAAGQAAGEGVLFVIARGAAPGPPLAVARLAAGPFPLDFTLGPENVMVPGRPFAGAMKLSVRLDRDGDPLTRGADDLVGAAAGPVEPGQQGIEIVLAPAGG